MKELVEVDNIHFDCCHMNSTMKSATLLIATILSLALLAKVRLSLLPSWPMCAAQAPFPRQMAENSPLQLNCLPLAPSQPLRGSSSLARIPAVPRPFSSTQLTMSLPAAAGPSAPASPVVSIVLIELARDKRQCRKRQRVRGANVRTLSLSLPPTAALHWSKVHFNPTSFFMPALH